MSYKLYNILGLDKNSNPSQQDIKKAYKKLAIEHHPDKNKDDPTAEEKFKEISNAYNVLSDEKNKRVYDQVGDQGYNNGNANEEANMSHQDIFEHFFRRSGMHQDHPFANHFGFDMFNEQNTKCESLYKTIVLTLEEVYQNYNKNLKINVTKYCKSCLKKCDNCNGLGQVKQVKNMGIFTQVFTGNCGNCNGKGFSNKKNTSCSICNGKGTYIQENNANLSLPAGINDGYKTVFPKLGEQSINNDKEPGDLIIEIKIEPHKLFTRVNNDLYYKTNITFIESVIGKELIIPYFNDTLKININIFGIICNGKQYMIENKGMPIMNTKNKGNLYIEFNINYPKIKNKDKIKELESLLNEIL